MPAATRRRCALTAGRQTQTINGVCSNCGRLKREEDLDDQPLVSGRFAVVAIILVVLVAVTFALTQMSGW